MESLLAEALMVLRQGSPQVGRSALPHYAIPEPQLRHSREGALLSGINQGDMKERVAAPDL